MIINFAYHSISDEDYEHAVTPKDFELQLRMLCSTYTIVPASDLPEIISSSVGNGHRYATITFDDGLEDNYLNAFPILKKMNVPASIFLVTSLVDKKHKNPGGKEFKFLNWMQLEELHTSGLVTIETHTHTHPLLTKIDNVDIIKEITTSQDVIYKNLGYKTIALAYPKGDFDERVLALVSKYVKFAFGSTGILRDKEYCSLYTIPRVIVSKNIGPLKFRAMLHPAYWHLKRLRDFARDAVN